MTSATTFQTRSFHHMLSNPPPVSTGMGTDPRQNPWGAYFGEPANSDSLRPYNEKNESTWTLPAAYIGDNEYLGQTMEIMILTRNNFLTQFILPLTPTDKQSIVWNRYEFDPQIAPDVPERGTTRLMHSRRIEGSAAMRRRGMGFLLTHGFMNTTLGQQHYETALRAMDDSVNETMNFDVAYAIVTCDAGVFRYEKAHSGGYSSATIMDIMSQELRHWDWFKRVDNPFFLLDTKITQAMEKYRGSADSYLVDERLMAYVTQIPKATIEYSQAGPEGPRTLRDGVDGFTELGSRGARVYSLRNYDVDQEKGELNALQFQRQIGLVSVNMDLQRGGDYTGYSSKWRQQQIYSQSDDQFMTLSLDDLLRAQNRTDPSTGKFRSMYSDPSLHYEADYSQAQIQEDSFHFLRKDGQHVPIQYLGNMYPGSERNDSDGDMTAQDYIDMAHTAIARMSDCGNKADLCKAFQKLVDAMEHMKRVPYNTGTDAFAQALLKRYQNDYPAGGAKTEQHPARTGLGLPPKVSLNEVKPNLFGFMNLPVKKANDTNDTISGFQGTMVLPPFFNSEPGLRTIAKAYEDVLASPQGEGNTVAARYGFSDEWFRNVYEGMQALDAITKSLESSAQGSVFLDPAYVSSWFHRPNPGTALVANLMGGHGYPLFANMPELVPALGASAALAASAPAVLGATATVAGGGSALAAMQSKIGDPIIGAGADSCKGADKITPEIQRALLNITSTHDTLVKKRFEDRSPLSILLKGSPQAEAYLQRIRDIQTNYATAELSLSKLCKTQPGRDPFSVVDEVVQQQLRRSLVLLTLTLVNVNEVNPATQELHLKRVLSAIAPFLPGNLSDPIPPDPATFNVDQYMDALARFANTADGKQSLARARARGGIRPYGSKAVKDALAQVERSAGNAFEGIMELLRSGDASERVGEMEGISTALLVTDAWIRTPLLYTPDQYYQILKFSMKESPAKLWPSSPTDSETLSSIAQIEHYRPFIDTSHEAYDEERQAQQPMSNALIKSELRGRLGLQDTPVHDNISGMKSTQGSAAYNPGRPIQARLLSSNVDGSSFLPRVSAPIGAHLDDGGGDAKKRSFHSMRSEQEMESHTAERKKARREVTATLMRSLDLDFDEHAHGNMTVAFARVSASGENALVRAVALAFVGAPATEDFLRSTIKNSIAHPVNYLVTRPHGRHRTVSLIKIMGGGGAGRTYYGHPHFTVGDNPATQIHVGSFTWYSSPVVYASKNVFRVDNVFVTGYDGGFGVAPIEHSSYNPIVNNYGGGSVVVIMVPRSYSKTPNALSLTGRFDWFNNIQEERESLHYPTAYFENRLWGWKKDGLGDNTIDRSGAVYANECNSPNVTCMSEPVKYMNPRNETFTYIRKGFSHWPAETTYTRCKDIREGDGAHEFTKVDYSHYTEV